MRAEVTARPDASRAHLVGRLQLIEARVRAAVARRRAADSEPDDRFRGLYISHSQVDNLLARSQSLMHADPDAERVLADVEDAADQAEANGHDLRLRRLMRSFQLTELDVELLLIALAPDLDPRFERLYGYLQDDVSRRRASIGLGLELCGAGLSSAEARSRLGPGGPLVDGCLVLVEETDRPLLTRSLRVPDRVTAHLLGDDRADPTVAALSYECQPLHTGRSDPLRRALHFHPRWGEHPLHLHR